MVRRNLKLIRSKFFRISLKSTPMSIKNDPAIKDWLEYINTESAPIVRLLVDILTGKDTVTDLKDVENELILLVYETNIWYHQILNQPADDVVALAQFSYELLKYIIDAALEYVINSPDNAEISDIRIIHYTNDKYKPMLISNIIFENTNNFKRHKYHKDAPD